eukprot:16058-Heterococcus_DN1.PRE.5
MVLVRLCLSRPGYTVKPTLRRHRLAHKLHASVDCNRLPTLLAALLTASKHRHRQQAHRINAHRLTHSGRHEHAHTQLALSVLYCG